MRYGITWQRLADFINNEMTESDRNDLVVIGSYGYSLEDTHTFSFAGLPEKHFYNEDDRYNDYHIPEIFKPLTALDVMSVKCQDAETEEDKRFWREKIADALENEDWEDYRIS